MNYKGKAEKHRSARDPDMTKQGGKAMLPHERDETADDRTRPRKVMKQALLDLQQGMVDTDLHGERGVETTVDPQGKSTRKP
ncbi:hypothetical protein ACO0LM_13525 [Undibacterium sp. Di26W]|uniref:hypothetical protein n=1 Tax=Undibacterium sp. Di26W TaxID=3413035 RepID=UPI003BF36DF6